MEKDERIFMGEKLREVGWSFQLLLALQATGPVKRFAVTQNKSWDVEFYEPQSPLVAKETFKDPATSEIMKEST